MKSASQCILTVVLGSAMLAATGCCQQANGPSSPPARPEATSAADQAAENAAAAETSTTTTGPSETSMKIQKESFGKMPDGTEVDRYTLTNAHGMKVAIVTYGAMITSVETPDRNGKLSNIVLSRDSLADYLAGHPFFGVVAGRYANRIAKGKFTIDGAEYTLATNNGKNHLHGGTKGFDKHVWKAEPVEGDGFTGVKLSLESPDGDEGYPGKLTATVTYTLTDQDELKMEYTATTDKPTHVNLTNHSYWNLAGAGSGDVLKHVMMLNAEQFLPVDDGLIPLGAPQSVKGTPMDFTEPKPIGSRIEQIQGGYDHCYLLNRKPGEELALVTRAVEPKSGRVMEIYTTQPGVQFYTGNFLDGTVTGGGVAYQKHFGFCLETEHYPDSPNHADYPSTLLKPGETYRQLTVHKFSVEK